MTLSAGTLVVDTALVVKDAPSIGLLPHTAAIARLRLSLLDVEQARLAKRLELSTLYANLEAQTRHYQTLPDSVVNELLESADRLALVGGPEHAVTELRNEAERQDARRRGLEASIQRDAEKADTLDREIHALDTLHADYELALEKLGA